MPKRQRSNRRPQPWVDVLALTWVAVFSTPATTDATLVCQSNADCAVAYLSASECINGLCTNPFTKGGCFANLGQTQTSGATRRPRPIRVCHSEDAPDAVALGHCRPVDPHLNYPEVRIVAQNWDSAYLGAWILQILLSEFMGVPATIESGSPDVQLDFYRLDICISATVTYNDNEGCCTKGQTDIGVGA